MNPIKIEKLIKSHKSKTSKVLYEFEKVFESYIKAESKTIQFEIAQLKIQDSLPGSGFHLVTGSQVDKEEYKIYINYLKVAHSEIKKLKSEKLKENKKKETPSGVSKLN